MAYYQGDYYQGDFFRKLGKGIKRLGKNIRKAAGVLAPIASIAMPAVGAATLVGRGITAARTIKRVGRAARTMTAAPNPNQSPILIASQLTGSVVGTTAPEPTSVTAGVSAGSARVRRIRRAVKRRRSARTRARARTHYRRRTRRTRRRSR